MFYSLFSLETIFSFSLSILFFLTLSWSILSILINLCLSWSISIHPLVHLDQFRCISVYFGVSLAIMGYSWLSSAISMAITGYLKLSQAISRYSDSLWLSLTTSIIIKEQGASRCRREQFIAILPSSVPIGKFSASSIVNWD